MRYHQYGIIIMKAHPSLLQLCINYKYIHSLSHLMSHLLLVSPTSCLNSILTDDEVIKLHQNKLKIIVYQNNLILITWNLKCLLRFYLIHIISKSKRGSLHIHFEVWTNIFMLASMETKFVDVQCRKIKASNMNRKECKCLLDLRRHFHAVKDIRIRKNQAQQETIEFQ